MNEHPELEPAPGDHVVIAADCYITRRLRFHICDSPDGEQYVARTMGEVLDWMAARDYRFAIVNTGSKRHRLTLEPLE